MLPSGINYRIFCQVWIDLICFCVCLSCLGHSFLTNPEIVAKTVLKQDGEHPLASAVVATEDLRETIEDIRCSVDAVEDFIDPKPGEEQEVSVLLTEQEDSEEEQTSANGVEDNNENEDRSEVQEQQSVTNGFNQEGETLANDVENEEKSVTNVYSEEESEEAKTVTFLQTA